MHVYCLTFLTNCGSRLSGQPQYIYQPLDNVQVIVVRFLAEATNLSLLKHVQSASMDPLRLLSTTMPTEEYFPVVKPAGARS